MFHSQSTISTEISRWQCGQSPCPTKATSIRTCRLACRRGVSTRLDTSPGFRKPCVAATLAPRLTSTSGERLRSATVPITLEVRCRGARSMPMGITPCTCSKVPNLRRIVACPSAATSPLPKSRWGISPAKPSLVGFPQPLISSNHTVAEPDRHHCWGGCF